MSTSNPSTSVMTLDPGCAAFLEAMRAGGGKPLSEQSVEEVRALVLGTSQQLGAPPAQVHRVEDRHIPGRGGDIPVRIYTPRPLGAGAALPVVLQFHGGGWAAGDLDSHDSICRYYSLQADVVVVSVHYRRPPEHKFPVAAEDAYSAVEWAATHASDLGGDSGRLAVLGDSAGGNLATSACLLARDRSGPRIAYQVLLYPTLDVRDPVTSPAYPSRMQFGGGDYFLSTADMEWFRSLYLSDVAREADDIRASPLAAADLHGLPPALIVTAGFDPLRDEAKVYADRLADAGVAVEYRCFDGAIHAFLSFAGAIPLGLDALSFVASRLRAALASAPAR